MALSSYIIILCALLVFYFIGRLFTLTFAIAPQKLTNNTYFTTFVSLLIGAFSTIVVYAIFKTVFNSILIGFLLLISLFFILTFRKLKIKNPFIKHNFFVHSSVLKQILVILIVSGSLFILYGALFYNQPFNNMPHGDYYFYSRLINSVVSTGYETTFLVVDPNYNGLVGATPYHYPEIWLSALFVDLTGILSLDSIVILSQVVFASILCFGIMALATEISKSIFVLLLGVGSLFFSGLLIIDLLPQASSFIDFGCIYSPKYSAIALFFIWGVILMLRTSNLFYFPILALPLVNIALAPAVFATLSMFFLFNAFYKKDRKQFLIPFVHIIIMVFFIAGFYSLQPKLPITNLGIAEIIDVNTKSPLAILKVFFGAIAIFICLFIWYFLPLLFLRLSSLKNILNNKANGVFFILIFGIILFFVSLIIWSLANPMHDSVQFHYLPTYLFANIIVFVVIAYAITTIKSSGKFVRIGFYTYLGIIIILNSIQLKDRAFFRYSSLSDYYSQMYLENVSKIIAKNETPVTIGILSKQIKVQTSFDSNTYWNVMPPLDNIVDNFQTVSLSSYDYQYLTNDYKTIIRSQKNFDNAPFNRYCKIKDTTESFSIEVLQLKYIQEYKINYLIVKKGVKLPLSIEPFVVHSILDTVSGEYFFILNYD